MVGVLAVDAADGSSNPTPPVAKLREKSPGETSVMVTLQGVGDGYTGE